MAKCRLGPKKVAELEKLTGRKIDAAYTRGGWPHNVAEVFFTGETYTLNYWPPFVDRRTGDILSRNDKVACTITALLRHINGPKTESMANPPPDGGNQEGL